MTDKQHDTQKAAGGASGAHTQQEEERRASGRKGGKEDRREGADGLAPGEEWRRGQEEHGSREGAGREQTDRKKNM